MRKIYIANWSEQVFDLAKTYGLGIEIQNFCYPENIDNCEQVKKNIKEKVSNIKQRSFHGPFSELIPASRDHEIRRVTLSRFDSAYEIACRLNAEHLILHTGFIPKTYPPRDWINNSVRFWSDFLVNKKENIEIHIENVYEDDFSLICELLDAVGNEKLSACIDIGHVNANSTKSLDAWIKGLNNRIRYVHLHNNDGIFDDHFGLRRGKIDIYKALELLSIYAPNADWSIETQAEDIEPSIQWLEVNGFLK